MKHILFLVILIVFTIPSSLDARVGVGVGTSKINIDEVLLPGKSYDLPPLTVINTGDEVSNYTVGISYHEQQPEIMPPESWFVFLPKEFNLESGQSQIVSIKLNIPVKAVPGNYFAYLEGRPVAGESGQTRVNIAAAARLNFQVDTSSMIAAVYYKVADFWNAYTPWINWFFAAVLIGVVLIVMSRFLKIKIDFKK